MLKLCAFLAVFISASLFAKDPFTNKEDAVGYIVINDEGISKKYIVLESKEGGVKLIRTEYNPDNVLKQGGKKR